MRAEFDSHRTSEANQGRLADDVWKTALLGHDRPHRRDVHDAAPTAARHTGREGASKPKWRDKIDLERGMKDVIVCFVEPCEVIDASVIDQDVDRLVKAGQKAVGRSPICEVKLISRRCEH